MLEGRKEGRKMKARRKEGGDQKEGHDGGHTESVTDSMLEAC